MSEKEFPPRPPVPAGAVPPVEQPQYVGQPAWAPAQPPRRSKAWVGWMVVAVLLLLTVVAGCALPAYFLFGGEKGIQREFGEAVAVIRLDGAIAGTGDYYSGYVTPEYFWKVLDKAARDDSVKAIVLRVDSPGGTVAASEEIASYVAKSKKPIIVSSGDVNASGAYMVSSQADEIFALPGTAVGSIGVISEIPNAAGLMDKLGLKMTVITAGKLKDTGSPFRALTQEERGLIQGEVNDAYGQFIDLVANGRGMERSEVESLATGWAWSGERAKELGLVDKIGTYGDALKAAADAGGIEGDYDIVTYDNEIGTLFDSLLGLSSSLQRLAAYAQTPAGTDARSALPK